MLNLPVVLLLWAMSTVAPPATRNEMVLYRTQADHVAGKGENMGEFIGYDWTLGKLKVFWYIDAKKKKTDSKEVSSYYGLTIDGRLYRIIDSKPFAMLQKGKFCYYENGFAHMNMLVDNEGKAEVEDGKYCFISKDLTSPLIHIPSKEARKAFSDMPDLTTFFDCTDKCKADNAEKIRACMKAAI